MFLYIELKITKYKIRTQIESYKRQLISRSKTFIREIK